MSPRARIAVVSLHTSPLDQPGEGDSGGMNVYVRAVGELLAERDVAVDVFTRCAGRGVPEVEEVRPGFRIVQVPAGPCAPVARDDLVALTGDFARAVAGPRASGPYDLVHSHYWMSGPPALHASRRWDAPLVASFHTLGMVKELAGEDEPPERLRTETAVIRGADRVLASTPAEAAHLTELYEAPPARIRVVPPGVDRTTFFPRPRPEALRVLGLPGARVALFAGRLQRLKGPDLAVRAVAAAIRRDPEATRDLVLVIAGGPSGAPGTREELASLARDLGIGDRVRFLPPRPHHELPELYAAAEVVLVPSRSESFGLVALEAQACGVPVVAAAAEGLRHVVRRGGFLVPGRDPEGYADRLLEILRRPDLAARMSAEGVAQAASFSWERTVDGVASAYGELLPSLAPAAAGAE